jgi:hypothetical protein
VIAHQGVLDLTSAEGLAEALGLNPGDVASVQVSSMASSERASLMFLEVRYGRADITLPRRLLLKQKPPRAAGAEPALGTEEDFYVRFAGSLPSPPVVRCLAARESSDTSPGYVLLEDLRASHVGPARHDEVDFGPVVDALACIHAARWESDERLTWPRGNPSERLIRSHIQWVAARLPAFFDAAGDALGAGERRVYERVCSSGAHLWLELLDGRAVTLVHGDLHLGNFLVPRGPGGAFYLIDWDRWRADVGARDLAFMMLAWPPDRRQLVEQPFLRRYLARLEALGVRGYGWDDLWADYRGCCVRNLFIPVTRHARGCSVESWQEDLSRVMTAFRDVHGEELL